MAPKRVSHSAAKAAAKKARADPAAAQCTDIAAMLKESGDFPGDVLKMLAGIVRDCLSKPRGERHAFQDKIAEMIGEALRSVERSRSEAAAGLEATVGASEGESAAREALLQAATEDVAAKTAALETARAAVQAAAGEAAEAAAELAAAEREQKSQEASQRETAERRARLEAFMGADLAALKEGASSPATAKRVKALAKLGRDFDVDPQLLAAAEATMAKPAHARGTFDALVEKELDGALGACMADLAEKLAAAEPERAKIAARLEAAGSAWVTATATEGARRSEGEAAQKALKDAEAGRRDAARAVKDFVPEMKQTKAALAAAGVALQECRAVLATYGELLERAAELEAAEPEAAPAEAAPAEAAALAASAA